MVAAFSFWVMRGTVKLRSRLPSVDPPLGSVLFHTKSGSRLSDRKVIFSGSFVRYWVWPRALTNARSFSFCSVAQSFRVRDRFSIFTRSPVSAIVAVKELHPVEPESRWPSSLSDGRLGGSAVEIPRPCSNDHVFSAGDCAPEGAAHRAAIAT